MSVKPYRIARYPIGRVGYVSKHCKVEKRIRRFCQWVHDVGRLSLCRPGGSRFNCMCGICGVVGGERLRVKPAVRRMMRELAHRGPNDAGYEEFALGAAAGDKVAGFGFRRLSILDLSPAGHQPMIHPVTGDCLIFNGEIYNYRKLRAELQVRGVVFHGTSDSEVLLHALSTWGESAAVKLEGMFAFAFYEAASRRILLGRDPLGIKPLYVADLPGTFVFASEIRALLASGLVPDEIDPVGVAGMLAYGAVPSPRTVHARIRSFPAGSVQWIEPRFGGRSQPVAPRRYWAFPDTPCRDDADTAAETIDQLMRNAVLRHLVADVPVGVFLSAGVDSTIIASFAREYTPHVTAFTVGFGSVTLNDETEEAAATAAALGMQHVAVAVDATRLRDKWDDWLAAMDSPSVDGFNTYLVSRRLAAEGVVVGISGLGADELFGGYPCFRWAPRLSTWLRPFRMVPGGLRRVGASGLSGLENAVGAAGRMEKIVDLCAGNLTPAGVTQSLRRVFSNRQMAAVGFAHPRVGLGPDFLDGRCVNLDNAGDGDQFNAVSRTEMSFYMADTLLRDTDCNSMANSLEARVPFLDLPLVNYVSSLPGRIKQSVRSPSKALLRAACEKRLSRAVAARPKTGFMLPIGDWMRGPMQDACVSAIDAVSALPGFDRQAVRRVWLAFMANPGRMHWTRPLALVALGQYFTNAAGLVAKGDDACAASPG